jgi:hypothetical protein
MKVTPGELVEALRGPLALVAFNEALQAEPRPFVLETIFGVNDEGDGSRAALFRVGKGSVYALSAEQLAQFDAFLQLSIEGMSDQPDIGLTVETIQSVRNAVQAGLDWLGGAGLA